MPLRLYSVLVALFLALSTSGLAQEPKVPPPLAVKTGPEKTDDPVAPPEPPTTDVVPPTPDIPVLPPATVLGSRFPREPLRDDVTLTPDRIDAPRSTIGSSVTVITRDQIDRTGQTSVLNILRTVPGLNVAQLGGAGQQTSVFMRGANSNHTKVLMDGIPINDPTANRAFDFANMTVDNIERIEVIRGPQSTLYGSDAIGGVINIITRRGNGPTKLSVRGLAGSFDTWDTSASISGSGDVFYYSFGGSYFDTDGFSTASRPPGNVEDDGYLSNTFSGRVGAVVNDDFDVDYVFRYTEAAVQFDPFIGGIPQDGSDSSKFESFYMRLQLRKLALDGRLEQKVGFNYVNYNRHSFLTGFDQNFYGDTRKVDYQANLTLWNDGDFSDVLTGGIDYLQEDSLTSNSFAPTPAMRTLNDRAGYVQNRMQFGERLSATVGARWDYYSTVGSAKTYRATSRYSLPDDVTAIHGSIGTGFHAPSMNQLFGFGGNTSLQPEESKGWEIGAERRFLDGLLTVDATYFRNDFSNLIVFDFTSFLLKNVDTATTTGIELTGDLAITDRTSVFANYTYTDSAGRDPNSGVITLLLRRPRNNFSIGIDHSFLDDRANVYFALTRVGQRTDVSPVFGNPPILLSDYIVGNLAFRYIVTDDVKFIARVDNVFDEDYESVNGFQSARASAYAGFEVTFGGNGRP
ncbi:MAG: TonB-dependent receptor [Planctomycetota bacterium]|nr:TonB-dependent receptor [Planctomycetota bacterium]